ncbi:MAG: thiopurine S-methyltransferase [Pseudomonadota bacterium]|nr:thiopurine S-methyltransferase [Pseudomonadota bacterium]
MDPAYWLTAWDEGRTAFHSEAVHPSLPMFEETFLGGGAHRVLVPLCGKTVDLAWMIARGHDVVGVELSEKALVALHERDARAPTVTDAGPFRAFRSPGLTLLQGDVFGLTPEILVGIGGAIDRVWDRAALVALDPERRARYVATLRTLLAPGAVVLLETFDYEQARKPGPPHAVPEAEVRALWAGARVERLAEHDAIEEVRPRGWNLDRFQVTTWRIQV